MYGENQTTLTTGIIGSSGTAALRMPEVATRQGEIAVGLEMLVKAGEELRLNIGELESRLSPILTPERPVDGVGGNKLTSPEPVRTPLAETIHQRTQDIYSFNARVRAMLDRVEL